MTYVEVMESIGELIRRLREEKGEPLRKLSAHLDIDQAVMSKIETGRRKASREQIEKLVSYFPENKKQLMVAWMRDKILYDIGDEEWAEEALLAAEEQVRYLRTPALTVTRIKNAVKKELEKYPSITEAWLFGSFARNESNHNSDIDIMINVPSQKDFSLFDIFEIQHTLEARLKRKIDVVLKGSLKPFAWETAKNDLKVIYARANGKK